ncbi:hypothetical protein GUJ93_ZPchr0009g873 [Zizania palustris]|uniref:Uncharacterized protein n=1 Tax=Zizania palustris TaxID=103762 RepID=A0A8J5RMT6_ZIZPA|nr:hypothetical protein GUJ93_ZPchr0009g873 [Zizania palustris]
MQRTLDLGANSRGDDGVAGTVWRRGKGDATGGRGDDGPWWRGQGDVDGGRGDDGLQERHRRPSGETAARGRVERVTPPIVGDTADWLGDEMTACREDSGLAGIQGEETPVAWQGDGGPWRRGSGDASGSRGDDGRAVWPGKAHLVARLDPNSGAWEETGGAWEEMG